MSKALSQVLVNIKSAGKLPIVVFDLDDTLFSTARRNLIIIQNFAADHGNEYPEFAKIASKLTLADMNWSVSFALTSSGLDPADASLEAFIAYWGERFFTDSFVALDLPNPGAVDYVKACHDAGALIYYLTGRHVSEPGLNNGMGQGTTLSMTNRGFPFWEGRVELNLKLHAHEKDTDYKTRTIEMINSLKGEVIATFDNEPSNAHMYAEHFPDAMNFWLKTTWNPKDSAPTDDLIAIKDFLI